MRDERPLVRVPLELQLWRDGPECVWRAELQAAQIDGHGVISLDELFALLTTLARQNAPMHGIR